MLKKLMVWIFVTVKNKIRELFNPIRSRIVSKLVYIPLIVGIFASWLANLWDPFVWLAKGPECNSLSIEQEADSLRRKALSSTNKKARDDLMDKAFVLYKESYDTCKSGEAALQLALTFCNGLGSQDKHIPTGMAYLHEAEQLGVNRERIRTTAKDFCGR